MTQQHLMDNQTNLNFEDTQTAFAHKTDGELKKAAWLFSMMNKEWLVNVGSHLGIWAIKAKLPLVEKIIKTTIFEQFVGGTTLLECQPVIDMLKEHRTAAILDYGLEAKQTETDFNLTMNENIRAIEFASQNDTVPVISTKITGLARFDLLKDIQANVPLNRDTWREYRNILKRIDSICHTASSKGVSVFIDAEESWIQDTIDHITRLMMERYNRERVVVYNTFQMYRHDRLKFLMSSYKEAKRKGYKLGAKIVRGAYMEKERERAHDGGYDSPIHPNKEATDDAYNTAIRFCIEHYEDIAICNATHNKESTKLMAVLIERKGLPKDHAHLNFSQLYGMSDHLTFNLADAGFNVAKYVPYGPVKEVVPYLIRRAQENTAVTGDMSREYQLIQAEIKRRGL